MLAAAAVVAFTGAAGAVLGHSWAAGAALAGHSWAAGAGLAGHSWAAGAGLAGHTGGPKLGEKAASPLGGGSHQYSALDPLQHKALHRQAQKAC